MNKSKHEITNVILSFKTTTYADIGGGCGKYALFRSQKSNTRNNRPFTQSCAKEHNFVVWVYVTAPLASVSKFEKLNNLLYFDLFYVHIYALYIPVKLPPWY